MKRIKFEKDHFYTSADMPNSRILILDRTEPVADALIFLEGTSIYFLTKLYFRTQRNEELDMAQEYAYFGIPRASSQYLSFDLGKFTDCKVLASDDIGLYTLFQHWYVGSKSIIREAVYSSKFIGNFFMDSAEKLTLLEKEMEECKNEDKTRICK